MTGTRIDRRLATHSLYTRIDPFKGMAYSGY